MERHQLFSHLEARITGQHVSHSGLAMLEENLVVLLQEVSRCPDCEISQDEQIELPDELVESSTEEEIDEITQVVTQYTRPSVALLLEDGILMIANTLVAKGVTIDDYFQMISAERIRHNILWSADVDATLTAEDWYYILRNQHMKAVEARIRSVTECGYTGDNCPTRLMKMAATYLAALENLYPEAVKVDS